MVISVIEFKCRHGSNTTNERRRVKKNKKGTELLISAALTDGSPDEGDVTPAH